MTPSLDDLNPDSRDLLCALVDARLSRPPLKWSHPWVAPKLSSIILRSHCPHAMSHGMEALRQTFTVHTYEVDPFRELSVAGLTGYMQEAAWVHARELGYGIDSLMGRGLTWVVVRQQLQRLRPVWLGDSVEVKTWPSGRERMALLRDFEIRDGRGEVVARAVSHWFILDLDKRRPVPPESVVAPVLLEGSEHVLPVAREKLPSVETWQSETRLPVCYRDIDMNLHGNHASYLEWALEALPDEKWRGERLVGSDVQYLAETRRGDLVLSRLGPAAAPSVLQHALVRAGDDKELARVQTQWAPRKVPPAESSTRLD